MTQPTAEEEKDQIMRKKNSFGTITIVPKKGVKVPKTGTLVGQDENGITIEAEVKTGRGRGVRVSSAMAFIPYENIAYFQSVEAAEDAGEADGDTAAPAKKGKKRHRRTKAEMAAARAAEEGGTKKRKKRSAAPDEAPAKKLSKKARRLLKEGKKGGKKHSKKRGGGYADLLQTGGIDD